MTIVTIVCTLMDKNKMATRNADDIKKIKKCILHNKGPLNIKMSQFSMTQFEVLPRPWQGQKAIIYTTGVIMSRDL